MPPRLAVGSPLTPALDLMSLPQCCTQIAQILQPFISSTCRLLSPEDVRPTSSRPVAAGGFADIWEATYDGRKVILKCYRCHLTSNIAHVIERFCNEVRTCSLLRHAGVEVAPFLGIYSTQAHPFCLVYEYMDGLDVKQHLKTELDTGERLKLLTNIAQDLNVMHNLGIVHGCFQSSNILVDKYGTPRISGIGNVYIHPHSAAWAAEDVADADRQFRGRAIAGLGLSPNVTDSAQPTKTGDMYSFGVLAFEIFTGRPPFFELSETAAMYSMLKGCRPPQPNGHGISDQLWGMIERCWHIMPSRRMSIGEVVDILETELRGTTNS